MRPIRLQGRYREIVALIFLCLLFVFVRIGFGPKQMYWTGDAATTLLVAKHILQYHEFPFFGPGILNIPFMRYPPYNYYLVAAVGVFVRDDFSKAVAVVALESTTVVWTYLTMRRLFSKQAAVIAAVLVTLSPFELLDKTGILGTFMAIPFFYLGLYLFSSSNRESISKRLVAGYSFLILSATFSFAVFPLIAAIFLYDFSVHRRSPRYVWGICKTVMVIGVVLFFPTISSFFLRTPFLFHVIATTGKDFLSSFPGFCYAVWRWYFGFYAPVAGSVFLFAVCSGLYFFRSDKSPYRLLFWFTAIMFVIGAFYPEPDLVFHNFAVVYPLVCALFATAVSFLIGSKKPIYAVFGYSAAAVFFVCSVLRYQQLADCPECSKYLQTQQVVSFIRKLNNSYPGAPPVYRIRLFSEKMSDWDSPMLWYWQERDTGEKVMKVNTEYLNVTSTPSNVPVYLVCFQYPSGEEQHCVDQFLKRNPNFELAIFFTERPAPDYSVFLLNP